MVICYDDGMQECWNGRADKQTYWNADILIVEYWKLNRQVNDTLQKGLKKVSLTNKWPRSPEQGIWKYESGDSGEWGETDESGDSSDSGDSDKSGE